jgi:hypothetical protein
MTGLVQRDTSEFSHRNLSRERKQAWRGGAAAHRVDAEQPQQVNS